MPGTLSKQDIELIIEKKPTGGGHGAPPPPTRGFGGGDDGKPGRKGNTSPARYYTGIGLAIVSILMFFMALASAFLIRKGASGDWLPVRIPLLMWLDTLLLLASSGTIELARQRLSENDLRGFKNFWLVTTVLGVLFLVGQVFAWRQLVAQGIYLASNPASSFFYIFTGAHAVHVLGGVGALLYVAWRNFDQTKVTRAVGAAVVSYYWHFMDALWLFLLALLYLGK
jgi:cytochrome c oxidase subunit III